MPDRRLAGIYLHVSSLPGPYGIGDIGHAAFEFVDFMRRSGLALWQFLPLGPTGYGNSPYQPLSSFAGNELLIAVDGLVDLGLLGADETAGLTRLPQDFVDYEALIPRKAALLREAAGRFDARATPFLKAEFAEFRSRHDGTWLRDYALFRILKSVCGDAPWQHWPVPLRSREAAALARVERDHAAAMHAACVLQFLFYRQWQALRRHAQESGVLLFGDVPIYIALDSADAWARPELLKLDPAGWPEAVAGVPPDYFSADGQLWGNPLYDWPRHAATGYAWWVERLRASLDFADLVRIDHFRGFESYWAVPAGAATAREGQWEPGPADGIFEAFRVAFGGLPIVAENLGVITAEVEALRHRHGLPGMIVLQFAVNDPAFRLDGIAFNEVCYTGTHDNDTTIGWFRGGGDDTRSPDEVRATREMALRVTGGTAATIAEDFVRAAFSSPARAAIAPLQDLLGLGREARMNTPGRAHDNWRFRARSAQFSPELCDNVATIVRRTHREARHVRRDPA
ncbi:MAG TPA: 4-alpha-glucanotransferase [Woeseiaceae bacterium]|nr:4-alpha-glucanotransferase [Woeseiaceae bacterium]